MEDCPICYDKITSGYKQIVLIHFAIIVKKQFK